MRVEATAGVWTVRRRWAPRQLGNESLVDRFVRRLQSVHRRRQRSVQVPDLLEGADVADGFGGVGVAIAIGLFVIAMLLFGLPLLIALGELAILLLLVVAGVVGRVLFRRPWAIDAISPEGRRFEWPVVGWGRSRAVLAAVADDLRTTGVPPSLTDLEHRGLVT